MANEEHLAILQRGVEAWNAWCAERPGARPDLGGAELGGANLEGAAMAYTQLGELDLREVKGLDRVEHLHGLLAAQHRGKHGYAVLRECPWRDCLHRWNPVTDFDRFRSLIPKQTDHRFRGNPVTWAG